MATYFIIFAILALLSFTDVLPFRRNDRLAILSLVAIMLIFIAAFRGLGFADYLAYKIYFDSIVQGEVLAIVATEPGFLFVNQIITFFTDNSIVLFLIMAVLAVGLNLKCYKDYTPFFFIAVMAYFSHTFLGRELMQIRAGVAAAIALYAYRYIVSKQFWRFALFVIIGASFHLGSLVVLVVYPITYMRISRKWWFIILGVCLAIGLIAPLGGVIRMIPAMDMLERIQNYNDDTRYAGDLGVFTNPTLIKQLFLSVIGLTFYKIMKEKAWGYDVFLTSYLISTSWLILFNDFAILSARVATFLSISEVLLIASFVYLFEKKSQIIYVILSIMLTFAMLSLNIFMGKIAPFHTIFS